MADDFPSSKPIYMFASKLPMKWTVSDCHPVENDCYVPPAALESHHHR